MAAFLASIDHIGSLFHILKKISILNVPDYYLFFFLVQYLRPPTVADGLNTISAPLIPYIIQFCG
jgi:hypothetical protein